MKKLLLALGAVAFTAGPLVTVVACSDEPTVPFSEYLQIDGEDFIPEEDGLYIMSESYGGTLFDENLEVFEGEILPLPNTADRMYTEFGKDDSVVLVYNDEEIEDGYTVSNFEETFVFLDQKIIRQDEIVDYNVGALGNKRGVELWQRVLVSFQDGKLNHYVGAYHGWLEGDAEDSLVDLKATMIPEDYSLILETLGFVESEDGSLVDSDDYNSEHASLRNGDPIINIPTPLFEYEQIAKNAIKITYMKETDEFQQHYTSFGLTSPHDVLEGVYEVESMGKFNLGSGTWGWAGSNYTGLRDLSQIEPEA